MKTNTYIQYNGIELDDKTFITKIKEFWSNQGNKIKDIHTLNLYIKPEENAVYFVINNTTNGHIPFTETI